VDQTSGTIPPTAPTQGQQNDSPAETPAAERPGFGSRGRIRRRARFLRKARELAYRDLGGLVFNLHRFGERNDSLVLAKLATLNHIDTELRTIEAALADRSPITVLREAGITACPRCAAIHGSEDRFCPNCGLPLSRNVDLPIGGPPAAPPAPVGTAAPAEAAMPATAVAPAVAGAPAVAAETSAPPEPIVETPAAAGDGPAPTEPPFKAAAESAAAPPGTGRAPTPPARAAPPAPPEPMHAAGPEDSTEILHPQTPKL
jgi:hypothetical protein